MKPPAHAFVSGVVGLVHACEASFTGFLSPVSLSLAYLD
jgi:hypothetical protein